MKKTDAHLLAEANALDAAYADAQTFGDTYYQLPATITKWRVYWDNGGEACGVFPDVYDTEQEAQDVANAIYQDNLTDGVWGEDASTEPIAVEVADEESIEDPISELRQAALNHRGQP